MLDLMLDSGAFSAWKSGLEIDIREYAEYIAELDLPLTPVNLDVIPGEFGRPATDEEVEFSAQQSYENYHTLKYLGVNSLPVFHRGESWDWLERMVEEKVPYIGISVSTIIQAEQRKVWLDEVFSRICAADGWPVAKVHGFGLADVSVMNLYPWYSCDSNSWLLFGSYGQLVVPVGRPGAWDYSQWPRAITVSSKISPKTLLTSHYEQQSHEEQEHIRRYVEDEIGLSFTQVQDFPDARAVCNLHYFINYMTYRESKPFARWTPSLFEDRVSDRVAQGEIVERMKFYTAEGFSRGASKILYEGGSQHRLLSYSVLRNEPPKVVREYVLSNGAIFKGSNFNGND